MYNSGNSSKNVTGASVVDGTLYTVDIADDAVTADKLSNSVNTDIATGVSGSTTAGDALPKAGGTMTGNIIMGTSGQGIDFSAATPDGTGTTGSEVLDDYEEGTWTPAPTGSTSDPTVTAIAWRFGRYTKIGCIVTIEFYITMRTTVAGVGNIEISGLPFAPATDANRLQGQIMSGDAKENNATIISGDVYWATGTTTTFKLKKDSATATWSGVTGDWLTLSGSGSYAV